jgi:hypothetical protein
MLALQKVVVMADELFLENKREATTRVPSMLEAQSNPSEKHADGIRLPWCSIRPISFFCL